MRILVEILHPAHVHVFKHAIGSWRARGDEVLVLSREKECANNLLEAYGIPFESISRIGRRKFSLVGEMLVRDFRMLRAAMKFKPDVLVGVMGGTIVQVGKVIGRPAVVFYDTENATLTNRFVYPWPTPSARRSATGARCRATTSPTPATTNWPTSTRTDSVPTGRSSNPSASRPESPTS